MVIKHKYNVVISWCICAYENYNISDMENTLEKDKIPYAQFIHKKNFPLIYF